MQFVKRSFTSAIALAAVVVSASPAAAIRPTCSELATLRQAGQSVEQILQTYGTTRARLAACARLDEQAERFAAERQQFHLQRQQRGLDH
jgi:hypothetical protein